MLGPNSRVLLVAPKAPPYGGAALQASLVYEHLQGDGVSVSLLPTNLYFPRGFGWMEQIRGLRPFLRAGWFSLRLWRALDAVDVVHVFGCSWLYFFCAVWPSVLICKLRSRRVILNYHGGEAGDFLKRFGYLARATFRRADLVTAPSPFLKEVLERHTGTVVYCVSNVLRLSQFQFRLRSKFEPKMLVTRHLEPLYDVATVLRSFGIVQETYPNASLKVAGSGSQGRELKQLAVQLGLRSVEFLGGVPYEQIAGLYQECDILLNASRADNFPTSLLEAAASGLVIASTNAGGIPYIFQDGESALLTPIGDASALANSVLRVIEDAPLAVKLANCANAVAQSCDWRNVRTALYRAYGEQTEAIRSACCA